MDLDAHFLLGDLNARFLFGEECYNQALVAVYSPQVVACESGCVQPLPSAKAAGEGPADRPSPRRPEGAREAEIFIWRPQVWEGRSGGPETV